MIEFHTKTNGYKLFTEESQQNFGVFFLELESTSMTSEPQFVHSGNDMSGSMSDSCNDGRTKMQHLHLTLENIVNLFSKNADSANITLEITGFDDKMEEVILPTKIENDIKQIDIITNKIKSVLRPRACTNIEIALKDAQKKLAYTDNIHTNSAKNFLFMTDGNITSGSDDIEVLMTSVPTNSRNYFIGFGQDHDFQLLQTLASNGGAYYYIDKIENAGLVFGEIIHSILYTALKNVVITTTNGEIYDFEKNEWTTLLKVPYLCGEANKQYHVRSLTPDTFEINYSAENVLTGNINMWTETSLPNLELEGTLVVPVDLRKYMYRQRTLELLADAAKLSRNNCATFENKKKHQELMRDFRKELEEYAKEYSEPVDIAYMKQLCDDLYISEKTINTDKALLYTTARRNAQGSGGSYNITQVEEDIVDEEDYEISRVALNRTCTSSTQERVMRECSM